MDNALKAIESKIEIQKEKLTELEHQFENAKEEIQKPFLQEEELKEKEERLTAVTLLLNLDERASDAVDLEPDETPQKNKCMER